MLLISTSANRQLIAACCERSAAAGVAPGMTLANARALLTAPQVIVQELDAARNAARLRALAVWAMRFAPIVAIDPPDSLLLDVSGCERLHRGERKLVNAIANSVEWLGFRVRVACASTFGCAWALAHHGEGERAVIAAGAEREALRGLPIEALRLEEDIRAGLHEVNITQIGDLLALPRCELPARFGSDLLLRLDQALGEAMESIQPVRFTEPLRVQHSFDGPVTQIEAIELAVRGLVDELCAILLQRESGARRLDLVLDRIDASSLRETIALSRPSREPRHIWTLLKPRVERINLGYGVERIALTATSASRMPHAQINRWRHGENVAGIERAAGEMIDALAARIGSDRIISAQPVESHLPERAFVTRSVMHERSANGAAAPMVCADRPTLLLARPEPVQIVAAAGAGLPLRLRWRGEEHAALRLIGPERIADEWWRRAVPAAPAITRDYYKLQTDRGRCLWIYQEIERGGWFVYGEWT